MTLSFLLSAILKQKFDLCITYYYRGRDKKDNSVKRFHRAIFVVTNKSTNLSRGTVYQVIHGRPIFEYSTSPDVDITLNQNERYSGKIKIGEIGRRDIGRLEEIMRSLEVVRDIDRTDWSCQSWTREGVRRLAEAGFIDEDVPKWLDEELAKGEEAYLASIEQHK
jgi:hypothetical protein